MSGFQHALNSGALAKAREEHDKVCSCDPRYLESCPKMAAAILEHGKTEQPRHTARGTDGRYTGQGGFPPQAQAYAELMYRVMAELRAAHAKFPNQHLPWGGRASRFVLAFGQGDMAKTRDVHRDMVDAMARQGTSMWFDIILEEVLEAGAEEHMPKAIGELIQAAAMCFRAIVDMQEEMYRRDNAHLHFDGRTARDDDHVFHRRNIPFHNAPPG